MHPPIQSSVGSWKLSFKPFGTQLPPVKVSQQLVSPAPGDIDLAPAISAGTQALASTELPHSPQYFVQSSREAKSRKVLDACWLSPITSSTTDVRQC
jgi:hypothetical protein